MSGKERSYQGFAQKVIEVDESMREIASLDELYNELITASTTDKNEISIKKEEAKFARERILKLSLHVKNLLTKMESHETIK